MTDHKTLNNAGYGVSPEQARARAEAQKISEKADWCKLPQEMRDEAAGGRHDPSCDSKPKQKPRER